MASITIKNIPEDLHAALKELALREGRSLNQEVLMRIRAGMHRSRTHADVGAEIALVQRHNQQLHAAGYTPPSPEEIVRMIREDRNSH